MLKDTGKGSEIQRAEKQMNSVITLSNFLYEVFREIGKADEAYLSTPALAGLSEVAGIIWDKATSAQETLKRYTEQGEQGHA